MLEWRRVRVQSPGFRIRRRTFSTGLANMVWAVGRGNGRREGVVTAGASRVRHEGNLTPAVRTEMGDRIICQKRTAVRTMNGKKESEHAAQET